MQDAMQTFFATAPKGLELLLVEELKNLGASQANEKRAGVLFKGTLDIAYKACLWSRLANRILLPVTTIAAATPEELYNNIKQFPWEEHLSVEGSLAIDFTSLQSQISHTQYGAQKVKDAIVDRFRDLFGQRPSVKLLQPDVRINIFLKNDQAIVSIDLAGESLHRRAYRGASGEAPLKENLAAAILLRAGWPEVARAGGALLDPMCGSGTLPIEGAFMAADIAPGILRDYFGFLGWKKYQAPIWEKLVSEAQQRKEAGLKKIPPILGYDADGQVVKNAIENVNRAGLTGYVHIEKRELAACEIPARAKTATGLVVVNPPYGERLGETEALAYLYTSLANKLKSTFTGWKAAVFTGNPELGKRMGLRAKRIYQLFNGAIPCKLLNFEIQPEWYVQQTKIAEDMDSSSVAPSFSPGATMFANRLAKNLKQFKRWAEREKITCYRLYDADMPEYAVAIDIYEQWAHVQEYAPPKTVDMAKAQQRMQEIIEVLPSALNLPSSHIFYKIRERQKGEAQYEKLADTGQFYEAHEGAAKFLVNFTDYLDTGLFLDHRYVRQHVQNLAKGKRFLNLFAYTGTATVYAAMGSAQHTTTVDMSNVYLTWARRNLALNGFSERKHQFIQADCLQWLADEKQRYGLIFLNPPTFSNSKRMKDTFDVQRDHVELILQTVKLLERDGVLIFSTNKHNFKFDKEALKVLTIEDLSLSMLPKDFQRSAKNFHCWKIS